MRILQIVLPECTEYEAKSQRADAAALAAKHEVIVLNGGEEQRSSVSADVAHVYGRPPLPKQAVIDLTIPYVASSAPPKRRFAFRKSPEPALIVTPVNGADGAAYLPEAVDESFFASDANPERRPKTVIGSFRRASVMNIVEQTFHRISRFRDDVTWNLFERAPSPADLTAVDVWVDAALSDDDYDGFVAEALVVGTAVVASRTPINAQRLEQGRTGLLVPRNDPNELVHAILAALFKPEVARAKIEAAKQTAGKFRPRQRSRVLERIYETLIQ